jgi:hypothetical protein
LKLENFDDLVSKLTAGVVEPNVIDMLILQPLLKSGKGLENLSDVPEFKEVMELSRLAFSGDKTSQTVLFTLRQSVASDEAGDRQEGIRQSEAILECIDAAQFPVTAGGAHLKIGGALAIEAQNQDSFDLDELRRAVGHLESAIDILPRQSTTMRAMAAYNAALAFHTLWQSIDEWEGDDGVREKALHHGLAAIDAMNNGLDVGNRDSISRAVISNLLADGRPRNKQEGELLMHVLQTWLVSPEGKALPKKKRSELKKAYQSILEQTKT